MGWIHDGKPEPTSSSVNESYLCVCVHVVSTGGGSSLALMAVLRRDLQARGVMPVSWGRGNTAGAC